MAASTGKRKGTCSVCLRAMQLHGDLPIRHGFSAVGVRHGQHGGHHTGPCPGTHFPHLGISTEGTQWALDNARTQLAQIEDRLRELATHPDLIWYPRVRGSYNKVRGGLPDTSRPVTLRYGAEETFATDGRPTYAIEHRRRVAEQTNSRDALEGAIAEYERVLAHWSPEKYPTTGTPPKMEAVHMEHPVKTRYGPAMGTLCRGRRGATSSLSKTGDPARVTCKRCRATLGLPPP